MHHTSLLLSVELFVLVAALFLYAYISVNKMRKVYRYIAGSIAIIMMIIFLLTVFSRIMHHTGYGQRGHCIEKGCNSGGNYSCGSYCGHGSNCGHRQSSCGHQSKSYSKCGSHGYSSSKEGKHHRSDHHHGKKKRIEKKVTIKDGERHEETKVDEKVTE